MNEFLKAFNLSLGVVSAPMILAIGLLVALFLLCCGCTLIPGFFGTLTELKANVP